MKTVSPETSTSFHGLYTVGSVGALQYTKKEVPVLNASICFNSQEDNSQIVPVWIDCEVWESLAHHFARLVGVGDTIYLTGKMKAPRKFTHRGEEKINLRAEIKTFNIVKKRYAAPESTESARVD